MTLKALIDRESSQLVIQASRLPLAGLTEWFLATYLDELDANEETMDKVGPAMAEFYPAIKPVPVTEILLASRSWSNECEGKEMYSCIAVNGCVICYFPTRTAHDQYAEQLAERVSTYENYRYPSLYPELKPI